MARGVHAQPRVITRKRDLLSCLTGIPLVNSTPQSCSHPTQNFRCVLLKTPPVVRKQRGHLVRHLALFEVTRQQRESSQQQEQIGQDYPFVLHMPGQSSESN